MYAQNLEYPLPLQIRDPRTSFLRRFRNLTATLTAYTFGMKHNVLGECVGNYKGLLHCLKMSWTSVYKQLKIRPSFLPTLCKFCILLHCQALQSEISKLNHTLPNSGLIALRVCRRKVGLVHPKKIGAKKLLHLFGFSTTSRVNGKYLLNETRHRQSVKSTGKYEKSPHLPKIL